MMRKEREMSREDAEQFLESTAVGRLAMCHGSEPYVVPILFHYDRSGGEILLHCAKKGRKIDAIHANASVCFEVDEMKGVVNADAPCEFDLLYKSVIAAGRAELVGDAESKAEALNKIFAKYAPHHKGTISPEMAKGTQIVKVKVTSLVGKQAVGATLPYPASS
jgi:hypothetical protein